MIYLITGGCGFLGANIARKILDKNDDLIILDSLCRAGSYQNLEWLRSHGEFEFIHGDIRNPYDIEKVIVSYKPDVIYHLAGQVSMISSIENPRLDFEVNILGSFNLLNAVRVYSPKSVIVYSSSNKVYGDLEQFTYKESKTRYECLDNPNGFDESVSLDFHSPYGVSKGAADQYMIDFSRIYKLNSVVFRHSSMFGGRQFATYDQGWVGWFIKQAIDIKNNNQNDVFTISGNGKQVRDVIHADDIVDLYLNAPKKIDAIKGQAFNIGGGMENSSSILELFYFLEKELDINMEYTLLPVRESDQKVFVADLTKIKKFIDWAPRISKEDGFRKMIDWVVSKD